MNWRLPLAITLVASQVSVVVAADGPKTVWTFENETLGDTAAKFHEEVGEWKVADDDGNKVLLVAQQFRNVMIHRKRCARQTRERRERQSFPDSTRRCRKHPSPGRFEYTPACLEKALGRVVPASTGRSRPN
jgi:hypothetical protein